MIEISHIRELLLASHPAGKEIHVIADNLSTHRNQTNGPFLAAGSNLRLHFTPTYSSWPTQVENWFAKIQRHVIARGVSLPLDFR